MGKAVKTDAPPAGDDFNVGLSAELAAQAVEEGGKVEDRESGDRIRFAVYTVIAANAHDAAGEENIGGRIVNVARHGQFRKNIGDEETEFPGNIIGPFVILTMRAGQRAKRDGKTICRGISTQRRFKPVCIASESPTGVPFGGSCNDCALFKFNDAKVNPLTGQAFKDGEKCVASCDLYCWDPENDPEGQALIKVAFTASSMGEWDKFAERVENQGVKIHGVAWRIRAKHNPPENGRSAFYTPEFSSTRTLGKAGIEKAEELRAKLADHLRPKQRDDRPLVQLHAGPVQPALPSGVIEAEVVDEDVFAEE